MTEVSPWTFTKDGDPAALALFSRHYSKYQYKDGRRPKRFVGPGYRLVLITEAKDALFVWKKFRSKDAQTGINCSVFRNESPAVSSELILAAEKLAWQRWPEARLYTYVNPRAIKSSNPGYCFKKAGWKICGETKVNKLLILEKLPCVQTP